MGIDVERRGSSEHRKSSMTEPRRLKNGKIFQARVQKAFGVPEDWDYASIFEHTIRHNERGGRIDILLRDDKDFVAVFEIKATDWDRIKPKNVTKNLWSHQHQLLRYIDKFLQADDLSVCPGIVYPSAPRTTELRDRVESYLLDYGIPAYWFDELDLE